MKLKELKKLLSIFLLTPLFPLIGVPGEDGTGDGGKDDGTTKGEKDDGVKNDGVKNDGVNEDEGKNNDKVYSKEEMTAAVEKRIARERKKVKAELEKEYDEKKKKDEMTENERLKAEKEEAEKKASERIVAADKRLIRAEVKNMAVKLNIVDSDGAYQLMDKSNVKVNDDGKVEGVEESLKELIEAKTYLVSKSVKTPGIGDEQQGKTKKTSGFDMNALIRKAAGRGD